ncbi:MAG: putative DNA-binding protein [Firmicutes bacterium]|nr:putative DNA-binding protein [Bacillota bacterium]
MLDKVLRIGLLYDFYGALLTDKQQRCLEMHYLNDDSLGEIARANAVSRQAVYDILRRAEQILEDYELKLGLVERFKEEQAAIHSIYGCIDSLSDEERKIPQIKLALEILQGLINREEET